MRATVDGNEAVASVAYRLNEVCCIYPITPSSPMAELADEWSSKRRPNVWGTVPTVVEMQSEGGAAGALHGALQGGALSTTFTASQGLLLMIPNMYKIAGELTAAVMHVAARSLATQGLSIFGDHSDVMAVRQTGFAMLVSASVQEAHDLALVAQAATLATRVPFVHFFDGFRTSHELNTIEMLSDDDLRALVPEELVRAHRARALSPERPFIRGTAQNPDVYFQARETVNPFYARIPDVVEDAMARLGERTGRRLHIVDYTGHPDAERVLVIMGSGGETVRETVASLNARGERVGVAQMRMYRPFPARALVDALPASVRRIAVLDRTKEPGSIGEPLFLDVVAALTESHDDGERVLPRVSGGRYGLSSKEFTPGMVAGVFQELAGERPRRHFTVGITDDVSGTSLTYDASLDIEPPDTVRAVFFGLGADGTVGANKNTIKILGSEEHLHAQVTSCTTRRSRALRPCRTCASARSRLGRRTSCGARASSAATSSGCSTRSTCSPRRRPARRCCSTAGTRRTRSGRRCRGPSRSRSSPSASTSTQSTPVGSPARSALPGGSIPCFRPASSPSPAFCPATRRSPRSRMRSRRPTAGAARRWCSATGRRSTGRWRGCTASRCPTG
jgi:pyruvate-ferredoxin/flavodoxin oxidoreductase